MDNKEFRKKFEIRTKKFAISIIELSLSLPNTHENEMIKNGVAKAGISLGANYREANRLKRRADYLDKIFLCEKDANDTIYWLEIIANSNMIDSVKIEDILNEANDILEIFQSLSKRN